MLKQGLNRFKLLYVSALLALSLCACGGGGGGGGSHGMEKAGGASVILGDLSGDTDPNADGTILVEYTLHSAKTTRLDLALAFSTDGGESFTTCSEDRSPTLGEEPNPSQGTRSLTSSPQGIEHIFAWDSDAFGDLPGVNRNCVILRIRIIGGSQTLSSYLTVINDRDDAIPPELEGMTARAVENAANDLLEVLFNEPVNEDDAESLSRYQLENPRGTSVTLPPETGISYNPVARTAVFTLDGEEAPNLIFGETTCVTVSNVRDLMGNLIDAGPGTNISTTVVGDGAVLPDDQPELQLAVFYGTGSPEAGDVLILLFDEDMSVNGSGFSADDISFWSGGDTIGSGAPLAARIPVSEPKAVRIVLGQSPRFTTGTSRINVSNRNDVVRDLALNEAYLPSSPAQEDFVTILAMETEPPVIDLLTVNRIPAILNGEGLAGGRIQTPRAGFDISLAYHDEGGSGIDPDSIAITASLAVSVGGEALVAGTDLVPYLTLLEADGSGALLTLPSGMMFGQGLVTLTAHVADRLTNLSDAATYSFNVKIPTIDQRPFETGTNPSQVWNLVFGRDLYAISIPDPGPGYLTVSVKRTTNGVADFREDLKIFGLGCDNPIAIPGITSNSNDFLRTKVIEAVKSELEDVIFEGMNITVTYSSGASFPGGSPQVNYKSYSRSLIAVGGDSDVGALGCAFIDRCNKHQDNNTLYRGSKPYNPGTNLGVFTTRIFVYEANFSSYSLFRTTFDTFIPGRGDQMGTNADDEAILMELAGTGGPVSGDAAVRRDALLTAIQRLGRYIAVVASHEMGHSMGVAVNGAMPGGLFGGDADHFPGSTSNHIDLSYFPDLFSRPAVNIMTPATNFEYSSASGTRFNRLNEAYLKEKAFYNQ